MIRHAFRRNTSEPDTWRRYSAADVATARILTLEDAPATLTNAGIAAMTDPDGIEAVADVAFELESNRYRRDHVLTDGQVAGVADSAVYVGDVDVLATGRHNPARRYAVADTVAATLDDGSSTWPVGALTDANKTATVFAGAGGDAVRGRGTAYNGNAALPNPASGRGRWIYGRFFAASSPAVRVVLDGSAWMDRDYVHPVTGNMVEHPFAHAWRCEAPAGSNLFDAGFDSLWAQYVNPTRYVIPPSGVRRFTIVAWITSKDAATTGRCTAFFRFASGAADQWRSGFSHTIPARTGGVPQSPTRVFAEVDVTGTPGDVIDSVQPWIVFADDASLASGVEISGVQVYAGPLRATDTGMSNAAPAEALAVRHRFYADDAHTIPSTRFVNRVDVSGEHRASRVTSATVEVQETTGGPWILAGQGYGVGRLSVPLDDTYRAAAVRVHVEEATTGEEGPVYLTEIDPRLVEDVSDDVVELDVEWSRETDPGSSTNPVGNYEASTLSLTLDDTAGRWNPAGNTSLDVGHRIDVATGVRYRNVASNPNAGDVDVSMYATSGTLTRVAKGTGLDDAAPRASAFLAEGTTTVTLSGSSPFAVPGDCRRVGAWARVEGEAGTVATFTADDGSGTPVAPLDRTGTAKPAPTLTPDDGWVYVEVDSVVNSGAYRYRPVLTATGPAGTTVRVFATGYRSVVFDDGATRSQERMFEELLPAGVFYSEPYETDSTSTTVTIEAVDRLARLQDVSVAEEVRVGHSVGRILRELALRILDFDEDQVAITSTAGDYVIPYAYPSGGFGSYAADLAKATMSTLHVDPLERLAIAPRADSTVDVVAEVRADNALISYRRPPGYDVTASVVTVNASPLRADPVAELWTLPEEGLVVPAQVGGVPGVVSVVATYGTVPALNAFVHGLAVTGGSVTVSSAWFYSDRAFLRLTNTGGSAGTVTGLAVSGTPLVETPLSARREHEPSVRRYGERELAVDGRLVQTQGQVDTVADVLLDTFRSLDDDGVRRLPDLSFAGLGILYLTAGDRVILSDPDGHVGGEYAVLSRRLTYAEGAFLLDDVRVRETPTGLLFAIVDESFVDSGVVAGY